MQGKNNNVKGGGNKTVKSGSTQVIVNNQKKQNKKQTKQEAKQKKPQVFKPFGKGGIKIGEDNSEDKWRCPECTFMNEISQSECTTCGYTKTAN